LPLLLIKKKILATLTAPTSENEISVAEEQEEGNDDGIGQLGFLFVHPFGFLHVRLNV
jgi:hypothetical protein